MNNTKALLNLIKKEKPTKHETKYCNDMLNWFNEFFEKQISPKENNYNRVLHIVNWLKTFNLEKYFEEYREYYLTFLKKFNSHRTKQLTTVEFAKLCAEALKDDEFARSHEHDEDVIKDIYNLLAYKKIPLVSDRTKLINEGQSIINKSNKNNRHVLNIDFAKYFQHVMDFNSSFAEREFIFTEDLIFFIGQMEETLQAKRITPAKRTCKTTRKTTRRVRR